MFNIIPENLRTKCEIIVNTKCPLTCISAKQHQYADSYANLYNISPNYNFPCARANKNNLKNTAKLSPIELIKYNNYGYNNFKLIERIFLEQPLELINTLLLYLIKPEYYLIVRNYLIYYKDNWQQIDLNNFNFKQFDFDFFKNI